MSYFDRYLSKRTVNDRSFQLVGLTALYLAVKLFEHRKEFLSCLVHPHVSRGQFTAEQVVAMEMELLECLEWYVHPPTPQTFYGDLMYFVYGDNAHRVDEIIYNVARFLTELAVGDHWFVIKKPASIAMASIANALELKRVTARYRIEFLETSGFANDREAIECYEHLRETYLSPAASDEAEEDGSRVVSPDSVIPESTSRSSQVRVTCPGVNYLATELDEDANSNGDKSS